MPDVDIYGKPLSEKQEEEEPPPPSGTLAKMIAWRRNATRRYRIVETPLLSDGK